GKCGVVFEGEARVIAAGDDFCVRFERLDEVGDAACGTSLEGHDGHADDVGLVLLDQLRNGFAYFVLTEDEIGGGDVVVRVHIAGERSEGAIGHTDGDDRHVLERIRHGEEKDIHRFLVPKFPEFDLTTFYVTATACTHW